MVSESARPVHVGAVLDGNNLDPLTLIVDAVDHPVVATARAVQAFKPWLKRLASPTRVTGQGAIQELHDSVATFSCSRASARRAGAVHAIA